MAITPYTHCSVLGATWVLDTPNPRLEQALMQKYNISAPVASVIYQRLLTENSDIESPEIGAFLNPTLKNTMPDPLCLAGMESLLEVLYTVITQNKTIAIFGDYDVDGATSTALMVRYFKALGISTLWYIPERDEGYGPNIDAFRTLVAQGADVIVCVDCGTTAFDVLQTASQENMTVCVIDHHLARPDLPPCKALVNPNRLDDTSSLKNMCAAGVCFCVLVALNRYLRQKQYFSDTPEPNLMAWLGLVALGTVCDVVPLVGLNRTFVTQGLKVLQSNTEIGIAALAHVAGVDGGIHASTLGWVIGPHLNACGRMGHASLATEILLMDDVSTAGTLAITLNQYNTKRQKIVEDALMEAHNAIADGADFGAFICVKGAWSDGIIGIVAGRIKDIYNKPTLVFSTLGDVYKGSARATAHVDVGHTFIQALQDGILLSGGGHKAAAGCSVHPKDYENFLQYIVQKWDGIVSEKTQRSEGILSPNTLDVDVLEQLDVLEPYGVGNPEPKYILERVYVKSYTVLKDKHIKATVGASLGGETFTVLAFNSVNTPLGDCIIHSVKKYSISLLGKARINRWQGRKTAQFLLEDAVI